MTAAYDLLIVDDGSASHDIASAVSTATGWRVDRACTGEAAVAIADHRRYALILINIQILGLDGFGIATAIRSGAGASAAAPILAIVATPRIAPTDRLRASGIDGHIAWPSDADTLRHAVEPWRPASTPAPIAKLAAIFGATEIAALLDGFCSHLTEALDQKDARRYSHAHRLAGIAGTLGFPEVSRLWLAISEGDEAASIPARISARKALAEIAAHHI